MLKLISSPQRVNLFITINMYIWILCCHLPLNIYGFVWILKTCQGIGKRFVVLSLGATMMAIPVAIFSSWNFTKIQRNTTPFYCALCSDMCTPILNLTFHCQNNSKPHDLCSKLGSVWTGCFKVRDKRRYYNKCWIHSVYYNMVFCIPC